MVRRVTFNQTTTKRKRGRLRRIYLETIRNDLKICNLIEEIVLNRLSWRELIHVIDSFSWDIMLC